MAMCPRFNQDAHVIQQLIRGVYVVTYLRDFNENPFLCFIQSWIWGDDEESEKRANVDIRSGTGEFVVNISRNNGIRPTDGLWLKFQTDLG